MGQTYSPSFTTPEHMRIPYRMGSFGDTAAAAVRELKMPPYGTAVKPTSAEREVFVAWVAAGMPAGACGPLRRPMP